MKTIHVNITTCKRSEWCLNLLKQIHSQSKGFNISVSVFNDKCETDYSKVIRYCKAHGYVFYRSKIRFGKWRYWELLNHSYAYADSIKFDYFICLPDDVILVDNFFSRITSLVYNKTAMINFFTANVYLYNYANFTVNKIKGVDVWHNNWIDSAFATTKYVMQDFRIKQPRSSIKRDDSRGSGCGTEQLKAYNLKTGKYAYQTVEALCEHIGNTDSVMHSSGRSLQKYGKKKAEALSFNLSENDYIYTHNKFRQWGLQSQL